MQAAFDSTSINEKTMVKYISAVDKYTLPQTKRCQYDVHVSWIYDRMRNKRQEL